MKVYKTQAEVEADIKDGMLRVNGDVIFECNININAHIFCRDLKCLNLSCLNISCEDLTCWDLFCTNLIGLDLTCTNLNCTTISCRNLSCWTLSYYSFCLSYNNIRFNSWKRRYDKGLDPHCFEGKLIIIKNEDEMNQIYELADSLIKKEVL